MSSNGEKEVSGTSAIQLITQAEMDAVNASVGIPPNHLVCSWPGQQTFPCLSEAELEGAGLNLHAFLYLSALNWDQEAVEHYLALGADPLRRTFDGDCAARLGVANGVYPLMTPEYLNVVHLGTGETGMHKFAPRTGAMLARAISLGANMNAPDAKGVTPWDKYEDPGHREWIRGLIAERDKKTIAHALTPVGPALEKREQRRKM